MNSQKLLFSLLRLTLSPSLVLKLWKMRWGKASDIVPTLGMSCLITVLEREKEAVGPYGRWHTTRPSRRKKGGGGGGGGREEGGRWVRKRERKELKRNGGLIGGFKLMVNS